MHPRWYTLFLVSLLHIAVLPRILGQNIPIYSTYAELEARIAFEQDQNNTVIVNFWATWCGPCVAELPYFEEIHRKYAEQGVKVLLVSLDFRHYYEKKLIPFVKNKDITADVVMFSDPKQQAWIPKVHESWDGALPATLVLHHNTKCFHQGEFENLEDLEIFLMPFLSPVIAPSDK
jgi:thiol-disulfide isomerase/thioredoxin